MRGMTNDEGQTLLVYRTTHIFDLSYSNTLDSDIFAFNTKTQITDTMNLGYTDPGGNRGPIIGSFDFWNNNPQHYIQYGGGFPESFGFLKFYFTDQYVDLYGQAFSGNPIIISPHNPSTVYYSSFDSIYVSADSGLTWIPNQPELVLISVSPFDERYLYAINDQNQLMFSSDSGNTFLTADDSEIWNNGSKLFYDKNENHVYAITHQNNMSYLLVSNDSGKPFSWGELLSKDDAWYFDHIIFEEIRMKIHLHLSNTNLTIGKLYLGMGQTLYFSNDFGETLEKVKHFNSQITGIYSKDESEIYISTAYKTFYLKDGVLLTIKDIIPDYSNFYPLEIGTKWIYKTAGFSYDIGGESFEYFEVKEVTGDTLMNKGLN